jgi:signal transduction histidine kinase
MGNAKEGIIHCLMQEKGSVLTEWLTEITVSENDPYFDMFRQNGEALYDVILNALLKPFDSMYVTIQNLAHVVAAGQFKAGSDFHNFINNTAAGRTIILNRLIRMKRISKENEYVIQSINECFDTFIYHAVSHYSVISREMLEKQYYLLNQTHKDRLTLLGQMTSSFVHEFRNPLTSIMGFIQLLQSENTNIKYLDIISKELEQLNYRVTQFLNLSKRENSDNGPQTFSLLDLVNEVIDFLYPTILDVKAAITCNVPKDLYIKGSKEEFRQVLLNIILNAMDVIGDVPSPAIYIVATEKPAGYLTLNIANNGPKIQEEIISTIFEPFITTKRLGTGLGLFVCKEIIEKHGGTLSCASTDSITTFSIFIPCH